MPRTARRRASFTLVPPWWPGAGSGQQLRPLLRWLRDVEAAGGRWYVALFNLAKGTAWWYVRRARCRFLNSHDPYWDTLRDANGARVGFDVRCRLCADEIVWRDDRCKWILSEPTYLRGPGNE